MTKINKYDRPRVCLVYTGGTIGMVRERTSKGFILRPPSDLQHFRRFAAVDEIREIANVDLMLLMNKDSTNMVPSDWTAIANAIYQRLPNYDGFVVVHGTDTMHFSATALAFAFGPKLNLPIVFTGAQTTLDIAYGDARTNLLRALRVATENIAEVVIAFGEYVFRGCRAQKKDERRFDAFESPAEFPLAVITEDIVLSGFARPRSRQSKTLRFRPNFADGIVQFSLIPGLRPEVLLPVLNTARCKAVILQSFGSGNVPNEGDYSFETFIRRAVSLDIAVILTSQFPANSTLNSSYEAGIAAVDAGAIPTGNMTAAAASVKLRWILDQLEKKEMRGTRKEPKKIHLIKKLMNENYVGELTVERQLAHD